MLSLKCSRKNKMMVKCFHQYFLTCLVLLRFSRKFQEVTEANCSQISRTYLMVMMEVFWTVSKTLLSRTTTASYQEVPLDWFVHLLRTMTLKRTTKCKFCHHRLSTIKSRPTPKIPQSSSSSNQQVFWRMIFHNNNNLLRIMTQRMQYSYLRLRRQLP